jgi:CHAT domain-containing protein
MTARSYAQCLNQLQRGDLDGTLASIDAEITKHSRLSIDWRWKFLALKAEVLMRKGLYKESLTVLQPALPAPLEATDTAVWRWLTRGADHSYRQEFTLAAKDLAQAQSLATVSHPELLGEVALRLGTLSDLQVDRQSADASYRRALEYARSNRDPSLEISALGNLGMLAMEQEKYDEAVDWDRQTLEVSRLLGDRRSVAKTLVNTGWNYLELGDYDRSLELFEQAQGFSSQAGLLHEQIICRINRGSVYFYQHNYRAAEDEARAALQLARKRDEKLLITESLETLSYAALAQGQGDVAEGYSREAMAISRSVDDRTGEMSANLLDGEIALSRQDLTTAQRLLARVADDSTINAATRWEAQAHLATVYEKEGQYTKAEEGYKRAIQTIQTARRSVEQDELRLTFLSSAIDFYDDYIDFLIQHGRSEDALRIADLTRSQTLTEGLAPGNHGTDAPSAKISSRILAQKLHATLLVYWVGQEHSYLWVVTPAKVSYFPLPKKSEIDPVLKTYRQEILDGRDVLGANSDSGKRLYQMLVEPARPLIAKDSRVILLPAESLYGLNFETLIVPDPTPHFWIEDVTLSTASSLALLSAANAKAATKDKSLLLVGNPQSPSADFPALAQAPAEMTKVSAHFAHNREEMLEGSRATPSSYLASNPARFSYLHFVTHGTASHTRPLESAVILSKEGDSYKLYARDIVKHPLSANLVTISACNGAGTRAYAGEGLVGLSWAFLRAGAHNVIGALWEVSDATSTPQLMDSLYTGLDHGQDPATALRNAKLAILHATGASVFKKPFYWAPFQLYTGS